jgi:hypothetical protein
VNVDSETPLEDQGEFRCDRVDMPVPNFVDPDSDFFAVFSDHREVVNNLSNATHSLGDLFGQ